MEPKYQCHEHDHELAVELWAPDFPTLCREAARAFAEVTGGDGPAPPSARPRPPARLIDVSARTSETLLFALLEELVFLSRVEHAVYPELRVLSVADGHLVAELRGRYLDTMRASGKAVTPHDLRVSASDGGLAATVVLDV